MSHCNGSTRCSKLLNNTALGILNFARRKQLEFEPNPREREVFLMDYARIETQEIISGVQSSVDSKQIYSTIAKLKSQGFMFLFPDSVDTRAKHVGIEIAGMECVACARFRLFDIPLDFEPSPCS